MSRRDEYAVFEDCECIAETPLALFVRVNGRPVWIPRSQIRDEADGDVNDIDAKGDRGTLVVSEWIAQEKGLV